MSNKWDEFSNGFEELFNAPFEADESVPLEPDLQLLVNGQVMRFVILVNHIDYPNEAQTLARGAVTLAALDPIPNRPYGYNALRRSLQGLVNTARFGGLIMTELPSLFSGITITPVDYLPADERKRLAVFKSVINVQYLAGRPRSQFEHKQVDGVWREHEVGADDER